MRQRLHTKPKLWVLCSILVFIAFGFFEPLPHRSTKGDLGTIWGWLEDVLKGKADINKGLFHLVWAICVYLPLSAIIGWALHAIVVVATRKSSNPGRSPSSLK